MSKRLLDRLAAAKAHLADLDARERDEPTFAGTLAAQSMRQHVAELQQQAALIDEKRSVELLEWRLLAPGFELGSIPLGALSNFARELREVLGHVAAISAFPGRTFTKVPADIHQRVDARLAATMPGSTRLIVTTASNRDLFDYGITREAIGRVVEMLQTNGDGDGFDTAAAALGPAGARHLRALVQQLAKDNGEVELTWRFAGGVAEQWRGDNAVLEKLKTSLSAVDIKPTEIRQVSGAIENLSIHERFDIRTDGGKAIRIRYAYSLSRSVNQLKLRQNVTLKCAVTDVVSMRGDRVRTAYELIEVVTVIDLPPP